MRPGKRGNEMDLTIFNGKKVFLTGHTGFKGSWLAYVLQKLGANVVGYSLPPSTKPNHFKLLNLDISSNLANICDLETLQKAINNSQPDVIFHLAAQPLVRYSYLNPVETFQTNILGTVNVLESARYCPSVRAIIVVTTDKCYENVEQIKGYVETDRMGGYDPYSSSKGCAELVVSAYRNSFFNVSEYNKKHQTLLATVRAGNVIGGGDWSNDRLIPDLIRAAISEQITQIRYPMATRPWQHVLEPIMGYLMLAEKLLRGEIEFAEPWNFGPEENQALTVGEVVQKAQKMWPKIKIQVDNQNEHFHEAGLLSLNIHKAKSKLGWLPKWSNQEAIEHTIEWYFSYYEQNILKTENQTDKYFALWNL
jgi:CDP-glucose 4,6-dehydratase